MSKTLFRILVLLLLTAGITACREHPSSEEVLAEAVRKIRDSPAIRYDYVSHWDNRFNESTYTDSAQVIYSKVKDSPHGFGFYLRRFGNTFLYDGADYREFRHGDKTIVRHDADEIKADSAYFSNFMFFSFTPMELAAADIDTAFAQEPFLVYRMREERPSVEDSTRTVRHDRYYYVETDSRVLRRIQQTTTSGADTLQIIDCRFSAIRFEEQPYDFSSNEQQAFSTYREIGIQDMEEDRQSQQIQVGDRLTNAVYKDITGNEVSLYGHPARQTLVMFSFIGCGGCEYALRELKNNKYNIRDGLDFYYSSPVDKQTTLAAYLRKKEFPFPGFSRESGMNEAFSVYAYPTFVLIGSEGVVTQVWAGYDKMVKEVLLVQ